MPFKTRNDRTAEEVRAVLEYDRLTGILRWKYDPTKSKSRNSRLVGNAAGYADPKSKNVQIRINGRLYLAARLIWLIETGRWPNPEVDHQNRDHGDNRWENLREATRHEQMQNKTKQSNNTSGFKGVRFRPHHGKWEARINSHGRTVWRAYATTAQEAAALRRVALPQFHGEFSNNY